MWKGNPRLQCSSVLIHFRNQSNIQPFSEFSVGFAHTEINCCSPTNCNKVVPYLSLATTMFSITTKPPQPLPLTAAHLLFDQILFLIFTSPLSLTYPLHPYSVFNLTAKCILFLALQIFIRYPLFLASHSSYFADPGTLSAPEFKLTQACCKQTWMT